jgi:tetratricopeptide (TPR) repeat protein
LAKGDYDRAIADFSQAMSLDFPSSTHHLRQRAGAYIAKGDYDSAIADYGELIKLNPKDVEAYHRRGLSYFRKNAYQHAISDQSEAARLDPESVIVKTALVDALFARGEKGRVAANFAHDMQRWDRLEANDRAIADYGEAIGLDPTNGRLYLRRGEAFALKGDYVWAAADYNEAVTLLTDAINIDPDNVRHYLDLGWAHDAIGDTERAIADYSEAIRKDP